MTSTISNVPTVISFEVNGFEVQAPAKAVKDKPGSFWYESKHQVEITSGKPATEILAGSLVKYEGESLKRGEVHTSKVNEQRGTGGNPTVTHSGVVDLNGTPYQVQVILTGLTKDEGNFVQVWTKAFRRPANRGVQEVGAISEGAGF